MGPNVKHLPSLLIQQHQQSPKKLQKHKPFNQKPPKIQTKALSLREFPLQLASPPELRHLCGLGHRLPGARLLGRRARDAVQGRVQLRVALAELRRGGAAAP